MLGALPAEHVPSPSNVVGGEGLASDAPPPVAASFDASLLGNIAAPRRKSVGVVAAPSPVAPSSGFDAFGDAVMPPPPLDVPPPLPSATASSSAQLSNGSREQLAGPAHDILPVFAAAAAPAPQGPKVHNAEQEESERLLAKTKLQAQQIQYMRMKGDKAAEESIAAPVLADGNLQSTSAGPSVPVEAESFETMAAQLQLVEQLLAQERLSSQSRIDRLQQQLQESKSLLRVSIEEHSRVKKECMDSAELIRELKQQVADSSARSQNHSQTSHLITSLKSSLDARSQELQAQVTALAAGSDRRQQHVALAINEMDSVRACVALAADHAQAALQAKSKASGRAGAALRKYFWEHSCGWYLRESSGEQQGPLDMAQLSRCAPKQHASCWCDGFKTWLPYEQAMAFIKRASSDTAGEDHADFDAVQYHIAQLCFLHSRASDALERALAAFGGAAPAPQSPAVASASSQPNSLSQQPQQHYPAEVLEAMWATVTRQSP